MRGELISLSLLRNQHTPFFSMKKNLEESQTVIEGLRKAHSWSCTLIDWLGGGLAGMTHSFSSEVCVLFCVSVCPEMKKGHPSKAVISRTCRRSSLLHSLLFSSFFLWVISPCGFILSLLPSSPRSVYEPEGWLSCSHRTSKSRTLS